jgi:hypothetical protein
MKRLILLFGLLCVSTSCTSGHQSVPSLKLPYETWYVGLAAPRHMEVWVERVDVIDRRNITFSNVAGGVAGYARKPRGWHKGAGAIMPVNNIDLPNRIYLRWQSLVEPKTYVADIEIPQWVRDSMLKKEEVFCKVAARNETVYRDKITLGMAPGGIVKVWVGEACLGYLEVGRFQAKVDPLGPHSNGNHIYYRLPTPQAQVYIDKYGIPYGSW